MMSFKQDGLERADLLQVGVGFVGKWRGSSYVVERLIGRGAGGSVYLAQRDGERVAVKVSEHPTALSLEYDRLQRFATDGAGRAVGPRGIELDDTSVGGVKRFFLAMEFIDGVPVDEFIRLRGENWIALCLKKLVPLLEGLHRQGYIFGDVKPANILILHGTNELRLVDFGGVARIGQSVKEFTEAYDRAWWGLGSRRADLEYDLLACALLGLQLARPVSKADAERLSRMRPADRAAWLRAHAKRAAETGDGSLTEVLAVLNGEVRDMNEFKGRLADSMGVRRPSLDGGAPLVRGRRQVTRKRRAWDRTDWGLFAAVTVFTATLVTVLWLGA